MTKPYLSLSNKTTWPHPVQLDDNGESVAWCLIHGDAPPTRTMRLRLASVVNAYTHLTCMTQRELLEWQRLMREALDKEPQ